MEGEKKIEYPFEYRVLTPEESETARNCYKITEFVRLGSAGYFFYKQFDSVVLDVYNMSVRPSDTFVVTYPRAGTTWTQELVWLLQNNLDFEGAKAVPLVTRFPFIESIGFAKMKFGTHDHEKPDENLEKYMKEVFSAGPEMIKTMPSPRFIKSHIPLSLLPPSLLETAKVVYVARNPLDVVVSQYYNLMSYQIIPLDTEFKTFWKLFMDNELMWSPFFEHINEAWRQRNHPNMAFIFYEELSKDLPGVVRRLAKFFSKEYSEEQFEALCDHLKFDNFKNNKSVNMAKWREVGLIKGLFIRKGKSGGWRDHFDEEMTQQANRWVAENLRDTDLQFPRTD